MQTCPGVCSFMLHKYVCGLYTCTWLLSACHLIPSLESGFLPLNGPETFWKDWYRSSLDVLHCCCCCTGRTKVFFLSKNGCSFSPGVQRHKRGEAARTSTAFLFYGIAVLQSEVGVMHSSGRQEGRELPVWTFSRPINTFSQSLLHLILMHGSLPLALRHEKPQWDADG